jgi:hypothetical protein
MVMNYELKRILKERVEGLKKNKANTLVRRTGYPDGIQSYYLLNTNLNRYQFVP